MPHSILRGRWLRSVTAIATLCITTARSEAGDRPEITEALTQVNTKVTARDLENDENTAYPGLTIVKNGSSSSAIRKQAIADLGLDRLSVNSQRKSQSLLKNVGMFRRLPTISFECDPAVYEYFLKNPDVAVATWRAMDISQFQLQPSGPDQYHADAGDGSVGELELLLHTSSDTMIHCDGAFKSPLLPKPILARSLMRVQTSFAKEQDGRIIGTHSGDVFVEFPSQAIETAARVIAPVSHSIADRNFKQMTLYVHLMSQAMVKNPGWVEHIGNKLEGISEARKREFLEVSARSCGEARRRFIAANSSSGFTPDEVLTPFRQWNTTGSGLGAARVAPRGTSGRSPEVTSQVIQATSRN
ncbi:hypothetical protein [Schlesneria sp.]|uniref:hypothetical protein n=1 Tax=Schlesneria sp. TaxID=2762018 RepID=UPI002F1038DD